MKKSHDAEQSAGKTKEEQANQAAGENLDPTAETNEKAKGEKAGTDPVQTLQSALAAKENDFDVLSDKYLRLAAEYDNFRRRSQKEKESLYSDSINLVIKELLPVLDNIDRAGLASAHYKHEEARKIADGLSMIQKQVEQSLSQLGVCKIECVGQTFNPELHEAVMHVEDDSVGASVIIEELQTGYRRDDRVIRHSMVKVAN